MPYGDSVGRSGLDGFVLAASASTYVAAGQSIWELGTNKDKVSKANGDFKKRNKSTAVHRQQELTYYCVTPRHWEKKAEWESNPGPAIDASCPGWSDRERHLTQAETEAKHAVKRRKRSWGMSER